MKQILKAIVAAAALALAACAGDATHRSTGRVLDDAAITTAVKAELARSPAVDAIDINVNTYKGVVQLSGYADSQSQINQAVELARNVDGVQEVDNDIRLKRQPG